MNVIFIGNIQRSKINGKVAPAKTPIINGKINGNIEMDKKIAMALAKNKRKTHTKQGEGNQNGELTTHGNDVKGNINDKFPAKKVH